MPAPGQEIGGHVLIRKLGGGAFGEVWLARHAELPVERAIKIPTDPDYVRQLRLEGQIQFNLRHPNIVETVDLNTMGSPPYFIMEYVQGEDLRKVLNRRGAFPVPEALDIICQVLDAVKAAHAMGILHRDLKPENVLLTPEGRVKITDFGLGKVQAQVSQSLMLSGSLVSAEGKSVSGTFEYMSPEQRQAMPADPRDDLYAIGLIGCEILIGNRPAASGVAKALKRGGIPDNIAEVFEKACDDVQYRYASAALMLDDVLPLKAGEPTTLELERQREEEERRRQEEQRRAKEERRVRAEEERRKREEEQARQEEERRREAEEERQARAEEERREEDARLRAKREWAEKLRNAEEAAIRAKRESAEAERREAEAARQRAEAERRRLEALRAREHELPPLGTVRPRTLPAAPGKPRAGGCGCALVALVLALAGGGVWWVTHDPDALRTLEKAISGGGAKAAQREGQEITNSIGMRLRLIQPGSFVMGTNIGGPCPNGLDLPAHRVTLTRPYYLGVTEVTHEQYQAVMGGVPMKFEGANRPVDNVHWEEAKEFCQRLSQKEGASYRLPTEAEWEYACRAGSSTSYCFGDSEPTLGEFAWYSQNSDTQTHDVGMKRPNAWGLHDIHGNVHEWCEDSLRPYTSGGQVDPLGQPQGNFRIARGGSFIDGSPWCRSACRVEFGVVDRRDHLGFRVVRLLP